LFCQLGFYSVNWELKCSADAETCNINMVTMAQFIRTTRAVYYLAL